MAVIVAQNDFATTECKLPNSPERGTESREPDELKRLVTPPPTFSKLGDAYTNHVSAKDNV